MINRLDQPDVIQKRLKGDKIFFTEEIKKLADLRVDSENQTVEEVAKEILEFYKPYIE